MTEQLSDGVWRLLILMLSVVPMALLVLVLVGSRLTSNRHYRVSMSLFGFKFTVSTGSAGSSGNQN